MVSQKRYYIITDGTRYIRQNIKHKYEAVSNFTMADTYDSTAIAKNVWRNSLSRSMQKDFYVARVEDGEIIKVESSTTTYRDKSNPHAIACDRELCPEALQWISRVSGLENVTKDAKQRYDELNKQLADTQQAIADLNHYIEFNAVNAATGYKLTAALHKLFVRRRNIKDEMLVVEIICECEPDGGSNVTRLVKRINGIQNRKYEPRVLSSLFEDGTINIDAI